MVPIGALFYSSILMFRDGLKRTIIEHPLWLLADSPPIFDIYVSDFNAPSKKNAVCICQNTRQERVSNLFKSIYDGTKKNYPNGSMMLFIPIQDTKLSSSSFWRKKRFSTMKNISVMKLFSVLVDYKIWTQK